MVIKLGKHKRIRNPKYNCKIPPPPLCRIIKEGSTKFCNNCGSSIVRNSLFGELLCINFDCINNKSKIKKL